LHMSNEKLNFFPQLFFLRDFFPQLFMLLQLMFLARGPQSKDLSFLFQSCTSLSKGTCSVYCPSLVVADSQLLLTAAAVTKCKKHINVAVLLLYFCLMIDDFC
jgi:hypothetical protein